MDINAILGQMSAEQTKELIVEALTIIPTDVATAAIIEYADAELEELIETLTDAFDRS